MKRFLLALGLVVACFSFGSGGHTSHSKRAFTRTQAHARWRNDDGSETTATWAGAIDTPISGPVNTNFRVRLSCEFGGTGSVTFKPQLQYNKNGAGWNDVNGSSSVARSSLSPNVTDNAATTQQLGTPTYTAGQFDETDGTVSSSVTLTDAGSTGTEWEFCIQIRSADVVAGDQILFRTSVSGGGAYDSYTNYGVFNVGAAAGTRRRAGPIVMGG